jgi:endonuclease III
MKPSKPKRPQPGSKSKPSAAAQRPQPGRQPLVVKLHKALKSHYKPVAANVNRPILDQVLFACCLENAPYDVAEKAFARLGESYFDLNEVRVTTVAELAETLRDLPDPARAALSLRRVLQGVFESTYSFSLEHAKKHSIAHGIKTLEHLHGIPPFVVHHVASTALGGHFIPLDRGALTALFLSGIVSSQEYDAEKVPGIERLIPKKSGLEFSSLLHLFGAECLANLHGMTVKKILQSVNPAAKDRFPKRGEPLPAPNPPPPVPGREGQKAIEAARTAAEELRPAGPQAAARPAGKTPLPPPGSGPKRTADGKPVAGGKTGPKPFVVKPNVGKPITIKPQAEPTPGKAEPPKHAEQKKKVAGDRKPTGSKPAKAGEHRGTGGPKSKPVVKPAKPSAVKRHSLQLAKRKPR